MSDNKLTLLGHLNVLRRCFIRCLIAVAITTALSFAFAKQIFNVLILPTSGIDLIYIEMTEMISTYMKVSLASGLLLAMPYLTYQFLVFILPALTNKEKRYVKLVLPWIAIMFTAGVVFGYFILIPPAMNFLISFGSDIASPEIRIGNYISVITRLLLAIGLVFELPTITTFLSRLGVITPKWLASKRKPAFIFAFVLAAIITPTIDPVNQSLVAIPLIILYEMSIWLSKLVQRKSPEVVTSISTTVS
ncbi:twin-arginine translocase subunit TatC [Chloroflexota bacterium]